MLGRETPVAYHPDGIPYLPDADLHISISHTKGYAAVLLDTQPRIGIDIEYFVGFDIVEVAPPYDVAEITSLAACNIVFEFLSVLALQKKEGRRA